MCIPYFIILRTLGIMVTVTPSPSDSSKCRRWASLCWSSPMVFARAYHGKSPLTQLEVIQKELKFGYGDPYMPYLFVTWTKNHPSHESQRKRRGRVTWCRLGTCPKIASNNDGNSVMSQKMLWQSRIPEPEYIESYLLDTPKSFRISSAKSCEIFAKSPEINGWRFKIANSAAWSATP